MPLLLGARIAPRAHAIYIHNLQRDGPLAHLARDEPVTEAELASIALLRFGPNELSTGVEDPVAAPPVIEPPPPWLGVLLPALRLVGESQAKRAAVIQA